MNTESVVAITAEKGIPKSQLDKLAQQTSLPLQTKNIQPDYLLHLRTERLELHKVDKTGKKHNKPPSAIYVDFVEGKSRHRRLHGGGKGQDLAKAIGLHKIKNPTVLDLTAGMGGDAFVLASLGCSVELIERNVVVHALLDDALKRANLCADTELQAIIARLHLKHESSFDALESLDVHNLPDVIYLDPMFPERTKSAQVKKEMQFFHDIVGSDEDSEELLILALNKAKKRIVVKRPRLAQKMTDKFQPAFTVSGKSTRYDIYLPN